MTKKTWQLTLVSAICFPLVHSLCLASILDSLSLKPSLNLDIGYATSLNTSRDGALVYGSTPGEADKFTLTYCAVGVVASNQDYRINLALHRGNTVSRSVVVATNGLDVIREANIGVHIGGTVWVDAGVMPSHVGFETLVPSSNWNYTRSMAADFTPYYLTGVKVSWSPSPSLSVAGLVVNGWQNISDENDTKSVGTQINWRPTKKMLLSWNTLIGNENSYIMANPGLTQLVAGLLVYNNWFTQIALGEKQELVLSADLGVKKDEADVVRLPWSASAMLRYHVTTQLRFAARLEQYNDHHRVIVRTYNTTPWVAQSFSVNADYAITNEVLLRIEARAYHSPYKLYSQSATTMVNSDCVLAASLSATL